MLVETAPKEEDRSGEAGGAVEQGLDAGPVERHRGLQREDGVGEEGGAAAHAEADRRDVARRDASAFGEPGVGGGQIRAQRLGGHGLIVGPDRGEVAVGALEARGGAVEQFGRERDEALPGEAVRDVPDMCGDSERLLEHEHAGTAAASLGTRAIGVHARAVSDLDRHLLARDLAQEASRVAPRLF